MPYLRKSTPCPEPVDCRILTAALDLFVRRGYHKVSVHDVQKQADVSIGSIYNHFGGKEGIARALYHHLLQEFDDVINDILAQYPGAIERCNEIVRQLFAFTETHRNIIAYIFHPRHNEFLPDEPPISASDPFTTIRRVVSEGMDQGDIRSHNAWVASTTIFGGPMRMIQLRLDGSIKQPLPELLDDTLDSIWHGMLGDADNRETLGLIATRDRSN